MGTLVAGAAGLVLWIILWSIGIKPFDALLAGLLIFLPAAAWHVFGPGIKKLMGHGPPPESTV
jgi:hypothetical protein